MGCFCDDAVFVRGYFKGNGKYHYHHEKARKATFEAPTWSQDVFLTHDIDRKDENIFFEFFEIFKSKIDIWHTLTSKHDLSDNCTLVWPQNKSPATLVVLITQLNIYFDSCENLSFVAHFPGVVMRFLEFCCILCPKGVKIEFIVMRFLEFCCIFCPKGVKI